MPKFDKKTVEIKRKWKHIEQTATFQLKYITIQKNLMNTFSRQQYDKILQYQIETKEFCGTGLRMCHSLALAHSGDDLLRALKQSQSHRTERCLTDPIFGRMRSIFAQGEGSWGVSNPCVTTQT